jgi:peptidyl-prolyl cis-trans isomerase SurA
MKRFSLHHWLIPVFSLLLLAYPVLAAKLPVLDRMIASVNDEAITESELNQQTQMLLLSLQQSDTATPPTNELKKQVLDKMILEKLQLQLAKAQGIEEPDDKAVDDAINHIAARDHLTHEQLKAVLSQQGLSYTQFRQNRKTEIMLSKIQMREIGPNIAISDKEVDQFLNSPAGIEQANVTYQLGHILIPLSETPSQTEIQTAQGKAVVILKSLATGADFAKTAMANSAGQQALNGGDLGFRNMASIPSLFTKIVSHLKISEVYGPIQDSSGFHIIKLLNKRTAENSDGIETARQKAMELLYHRKFEELLIPWLRNLCANAEVEIFLNEK